jgi:5-methylcytosine-specific restriction enzyme A
MRNFARKLLRRILYNTPRSPNWPEVRRIHLEKEPWCRVCASMKDLEVHHIKPVHYNPELELEPSNLITLCESIGVNCHFVHGHLGNWKYYNMDISLFANAPDPRVPMHDLYY